MIKATVPVVALTLSGFALSAVGARPFRTVTRTNRVGGGGMSSAAAHLRYLGGGHGSGHGPDTSRPSVSLFSFGSFSVMEPPCYFITSLALCLWPQHPS